MSQVDAAMKRFETLVHVTINPIGHEYEDGPLSETDFDEMSMLARYLGTQLPEKVNSILAENYSPQTGWLRTLGERLSRAQDFSTEFGSLRNRDNASQLLPKFSPKEKDKQRELELCTDILRPRKSKSYLRRTPTRRSKQPQVGCQPTIPANRPPMTGSRPARG